MVKEGLVGMMEPEHPDFYAALEEMAFRATGKRGQKPDGRMLGTYLRRFKGRVINGKRFMNEADEKRGAEWWVENVVATRRRPRPEGGWRGGSVG